jgi:hypothetical protein
MDTAMSIEGIGTCPEAKQGFLEKVLRCGAVPIDLGIEKASQRLAV